MPANQFIRVDSDVTIKTIGKGLIKDVTSNNSMRRRQAVGQTKITDHSLVKKGK